MGMKELAEELAGTTSEGSPHIGLTDSLKEGLDIQTSTVTRGRLMAETEDDRSHLGVYLLAVYVVDDTDFWGDGQIYWWSVPAMSEESGHVAYRPLSGLPNGMAPHRCGSLEWMTNLSLKTPPLLAVIPPDGAKLCTVRLGLYDDDRAPADLPGAMSAGLEQLQRQKDQRFNDPGGFIQPVRDAIFDSLKAYQDDILVEQDISIRRGEKSGFAAAGMIGSLVTALARVYYLVKDEQRTETFGPILLHKGQSDVVKFNQPLEPGGRLTLFARGGDISCTMLGDLTNELPFQNRVLDERQAAAINDGFNVMAQGNTKLVAYYTPPRPLGSH